MSTPMPTTTTDGETSCHTLFGPNKGTHMSMVTAMGIDAAAFGAKNQPDYQALLAMGQKGLDSQTQRIVFRQVSNLFSQKIAGMQATAEEFGVTGPCDTRQACINSIMSHLKQRKKNPWVQFTQVASPAPATPQAVPIKAEDTITASDRRVTEDLVAIPTLPTTTLGNAQQATLPEFRAPLSPSPSPPAHGTDRWTASQACGPGGTVPGAPQLRDILPASSIPGGFPGGLYGMTSMPGGFPSLNNSGASQPAASRPGASNQATSNQATSNQATSNQATSNQATSNQATSNLSAFRPSVTNTDRNRQFEQVFTAHMITALQHVQAQHPNGAGNLRLYMSGFTNPKIEEAISRVTEALFELSNANDAFQEAMTNLTKLMT